MRQRISCAFTNHISKKTVWTCISSAWIFWYTLIASRILLNSNLSSFLTVVKQSAAAVFLWRICEHGNIYIFRSFMTELYLILQEYQKKLLSYTAPKRDFPFTMQYGISIFLHKAGSHTTNSMGSTSWAITTSWALFCETGNHLIG